MQSRVFIVIVVITFHNYIKGEAQKDLLFEKYGNSNMIDDEDEDEMLARFMLLHLDSKIDSFRDSFINLIAMGLRVKTCV